MLERKLVKDLDLQIDLGDWDLIKPTLCHFFFRQAADAMEWILMCVVGDMEFNQDIEDKIPNLCRFYNNLIGDV